MTIFNLGRIDDGSYKGASFSAQDVTLDGGRKKVIHEYPNKTKRFVEDLGGLEKKFSITVWTDDNVNFNQRDSLISALDSDGAATLYLPNYTVDNVVSIGYSVKDNIREIGISKFTISFEKASLNAFPIAKIGNKGLLANLKEKLLGDNEAAFNNGIKAIGNSKAKFDSFNKTVKDTAREIKRVSQTVAGSVDTFSDFATSINEIVDSSAALARTPSVLSAKLTTSFRNLELAYENSKDVFDVVKGLFGLNQSDQTIVGSSQQQSDIQINQNQIRNLVSAAAVATACNVAANIEYANTDELNEVVTDIDNGFNLLPDSLDRDIRNSLIEMRIELLNVVSDLSLSLPRISDYVVNNPMSLTVLTYQLYGSLDLKNTIRDMNQFNDTSRINGTIKILTNV